VQDARSHAATEPRASQGFRRQTSPLIPLFWVFWAFILGTTHDRRRVSGHAFAGLPCFFTRQRQERDSCFRYARFLSVVSCCELGSEVL